MSAQAEFDFSAPPPAPEKPRSSAPPRAEILERIKKLLRLGQSPNAHEAAIAMQRAFELANRHGVDVESLDLDERTEKLVHEFYKCGERPSHLRKQIIAIVMTYFNVSAVHSSDRICFLGRETDVAIAGYAFEFLVRTGERLLREYCDAEKKARRKANGAKRYNWSVGFIYGIGSNLRSAAAAMPISDSRAALVVAEEKAREAYMGEVFPNTVTKKLTDAKHRKNDSAIENGWRHGKATNVSTPLNGASAAIPLLV